MDREICWISNRDQANEYKKYLHQFSVKNYSEILDILILNQIAPEGAKFNQTWLMKIEKIKEDMLETIYRENPAEELHICVVNNFFWTFIPAIILLFGTVGNVISFIVLCNFTGKTVSTFVYLSLLALVDQVVLIFGLMRSWIDHLSMSKMEHRNRMFCKLSQFLGTSASVLSVWLIVAVTLERTIVITFPFKARKLIQKQRAIIASTLMAVLIICLNSHFLFSVDLVTSPSILDPTKNISLCKFSDGFSFVETSWILIDAIVYSFLPFTLILTLNIIIMVKVCQARRNRRSLMTMKRRPHSSERSESTRQLTIMLLMISGTFLITTTPVFIFKLIHWAPTLFKRNIIDKTVLNTRAIATSQFADSITTFLTHLNHAMNFYLYCGSGNKFRAGLKTFFRKRWFVKIFLSSPDPNMAQNSLFGNSIKMTRNINESKLGNDNQMVQIHHNFQDN